MGQLHDTAQIGTDAVIGGVVHQHSLSVRIFPNGLFHSRNAHAERDAEPLITFRVDIDRDGAAQDHGSHHAAVHVARQDEFFPPQHTI